MTTHVDLQVHDIQVHKQSKSRPETRLLTCIRCSVEERETKEAKLRERYPRAEIYAVAVKNEM